MNRAEKRRLTRCKNYEMDSKIYENNKMWFENLPIDKKVFIEDYIERILNIGNELFIDIYDKCIASSIDDNLAIDVTYIRKIIEESNTYIFDYKNYIEKEGNGGINMIENEELKNNIKNKIIEYRDNKIEKAKGLKMLRNEFNIPFAELSDLWIECKSKKKGCKNMNNVNDKPDENAVKNEELEVVNIFKEIRGRHNNYIKSMNGVTIGSTLYKDAACVESEKSIKLEQYTNERNMIEEQIMALRDKLDNIEHNYNIDKERYEELLKVMALPL